MDLFAISGMCLTRSCKKVARGIRSRCHGSIIVVAHSGNSPTIERTFSRWPCRREAQNIVIETVFLVPHSLWTFLFIAAAIHSR